jgi:hypothetical protein
VVFLVVRSLTVGYMYVQKFLIIFLGNSFDIILLSAVDSSFLGIAPIN